MRTIESTSQFKRDYKRESKGRHRTTIVMTCFRLWIALLMTNLLNHVTVTIPCLAIGKTTVIAT